VGPKQRIGENSVGTIVEDCGRFLGECDLDAKPQGTRGKR
jgi:hypothetical protein